MLRKKLIRRTERKIEEKMAGPEIHIIKAVNLLTDLDAVANLMKENLEDWRKKMPKDEARIAFLELEKNSARIDEERKRTMVYIETEIAKELPKFTKLATPLVAAKLLASAGSKKDLCFAPSSTIQVLGAEKALFAHLKKKGKCPKHGHIFNHPDIQKAPREKRGKLSRKLAGKLSMALKQDYFAKK